MYTERQLLDLLRELAVRLEKTPTAKEMGNADGPPSAALYQKRFGSWNNALKAAGLKINMSRDMSSKYLIKKLQELAVRIGKAPTANDMRDADGFPDVGPFLRCFGSWNNALMEAGSKTNSVQSMSKKHLITMLQDLKHELGRTPKTTDMNSAMGYPNASTYQRRFGGWGSALKAAGFVVNVEWLLTDECLIERLIDLAEELGHTPTQDELGRYTNYPSAKSYYTHFGGLRAAAELAGLEPKGRGGENNPRWVGDKEHLRNELLRLQKELGKVPTAVDIRDAEGYPDTGTYTRRFGTWNEALTFAGLPHNNIIGGNNVNWKGGVSFEPYCPKFNLSFKESIRDRFARKCFLCSKAEEDNGKKLSVHHVNYNKDCLCDDSDCEFVPLCGSCHTKTNHNREYWEENIMNKLREEE